jgi:hypothetical protein
MPAISAATAARLEAALLDAEARLPILVQEIMRSCVLRRELLRSCAEDERMAGQWNATDQVLTFNGPAIARLSGEALFSLLAHEAAHIFLWFTRHGRQSDESFVADLAATWGANPAQLYRETGRGV